VKNRGVPSALRTPSRAELKLVAPFASRSSSQGSGDFGWPWSGWEEKLNMTQGLGGAGEAGV